MLVGLLHAMRRMSLQCQANRVSKMPRLNMPWLNQRFASCGKGGARILAGTGASMPGTMYAEGYRTSLGSHGGYSISLPGINSTKATQGSSSSSWE